MILNTLKLKKGFCSDGVGLRLQDVVMRAETQDIIILNLRREVLVRLKSYPLETERVAVLNTVCEKIIEVNLNTIKESTKRVFVPCCSKNKGRWRLILGGATSAISSQEMECYKFKMQGHVVDLPGAIEGRDMWNATGGDTIVICTRSGLEMAKTKSVANIINLAEETILTLTDGNVLRGLDIYYKSDALLLLMIISPGSSILHMLLDELGRGPLIDIYNLDEETQIVLFLLAKKADVMYLDIYANSPGAAEQLNKKGFKYPIIEDVLDIGFWEDPYKMQDMEWRLSQSSEEINYHPDCVPGYLITRPDTYEKLHEKLLMSLMFLSTRYLLTMGQIKTNQGTYGDSQGSIAIELTNYKDTEQINNYLRQGCSRKALELYEKSLTNIQEIIRWSREMWSNGGDWIIEAHTYYFTIIFPYDDKIRELITATSVHMIDCSVRDTVSLQIIDGTTLGGNLICSYNTWERLVKMITSTDYRIINNPDLRDQLRGIYALMTKGLRDYVGAVNTSEKYRNGQIRGGADLAIATLGGKFGNDKIIMAVQDYNARVNGCETAYSLYDQAQKVYGEKGEAVTRNITTKVPLDVFYALLPEAVNKLNSVFKKAITMEQVRLITISGGWGQIGIIGTDALGIMQDVFRLEDLLRDMDVIK